MVNFGNILGGNKNFKIENIQVLIGGSGLRWDGHLSSISVFCRIEQNVLVSGGGEGEIKIWDLEQQTLISSLKGHSKRSILNCLILENSGNELISCADDQTIRFWDLTKNKEYRKINFRTPLAKIILD